jgi:hypothetical protein
MPISMLGKEIKFPWGITPEESEEEKRKKGEERRREEERRAALLAKPEPKAEISESRPQWHYQQPADLSMPSEPRRIKTQYGSSLDVYNQYGIPYEQFFLKAWTPLEEGQYGSPGLIPKDWFDSNVPLSIWMPDGTIAKAKSPEEFRDMVSFAGRNQRYLPSVSEYPAQSNTPTRIIDFQGLQDDIAKEKALDTPEKLEVERWQLELNRYETFQSNFRKYEELRSEDPDIPDSPMAKLYKKRISWQQDRFDRYTIEEIETRLQEARENYAKSLQPSIPSEITPIATNMGMAFEVRGWTILPSNTFKTPKGEILSSREILDNPDEFTDFVNSIPHSGITAFREGVANDPEAFNRIMRRMGDTPTSRMALKKLIPDITDDDIAAYFQTILPLGAEIGEGGRLVSMRPATTEEIETGIRPETGYPWNAPPTKWQEFEDAFTKYWAKEKQQGEERFKLLEGSMPERVKNIGKWLATQVLVPQQIREALNLYDLAADVWRLGVSSFFRDEPYTLWEPPDWTNLMTTAGVIPGKEYTLGAKEIIDISNPINWIPFGGTAQAITPTERLTGEIAAKFITGTSRKEVLTFARKEASKLGIKAEPIIAEAEARVIKALQRQIAPKEVTVPVTKVAKPNEPFEAGMVKQADGTFAKTGKVTFREIKEGDAIPDVGSPERYDDPLTGKTYVRSAAQGERVMAGQMPASFENVPSEIRASRRLVAERMFLNGESQEQVIKTLSLDMPEDSAKWLADDVQRGLEKSEFVERRQAQITTEAERRGSVAPEAKPPETPAAVVGKGRAEIIEKSIKAEIDIKKEQARAAVQDAWDAFKQTGITANLKENAEKQANLYTALVELARVHIEAGVKTIEEFARLVGIEINAAVRAAWGTAQKGKVASFDSLTSNTKKSLSNVKMIIRQQFNTEERAAVDNLIATSKKFDEIWETTTAERQAELARKTARLEKAQQEFEGIERIAEENKARAGLLTDIGLTEREMVITSENAKVLEGMIYKSSELDVWEKANAARAMRALVEDWRIPRPFEREYFKKVFGYDAVGIFSQSTKPRLGDYFTEVLYNSFISLKSNVVNFGGNAIASILSPVEKFGAAMMEAPLARMGGRARQRFMGEAVQDLVGAWTGIPDGVRAWLEVMKSGQISGTALKAEMTRPRAFKGKLGRVINFNTDLMYAFDELFKSINKSAAIRSEAYRMASKEGFRGNNLYGRLNVLINDSPEELIKSANKISEYRLFRAQSDFANSIMKLRDIEIGKGVKPIQLIIPFVKTPVNLAKFGIERSPMAIFNPKLINNLIKKNPEASDLLARWAMGTIVALAVTIYARDRLITGAAPRTVGERDEFYRLGKQPYSLKIGNKWISYQRLEPFNQMFLQASVIADSLADKDKNLDELAEGFAFGILQNITNQTFLTGVSDTLNALVEPDRYGEGYFQRMLANLMPGSSTARLMAQTVDTTVRAPQTFVEQIESNIPGLSQKVNPKINIFGEPQTRETPALMPYAYSTEKDDKITKVMADAGVSPGFVGDSITDGKKKYKLNEQELYNYQVLAGQILKKKMISVIGNKSKVSADVLNNAIQEARAIAKQEELRILKRAGRKPDAE